MLMNSKYYKLKNLKHGYKIQKDDIIKLGRVRFRVKEMVISNIKPKTKSIQKSKKSPD